MAHADALHSKSIRMYNRTVIGNQRTHGFILVKNSGRTHPSFSMKTVVVAVAIVEFIK